MTLGINQFLKNSKVDKLLMEWFIVLLILFIEMGNKQAVQAKELQLEINHPRLSKAKIITRENQKFLQISQSIDEKEYDKWKAALQKYKNNVPDNLLLPKSEAFNRVGLCGNTGTLVINYENYPYLLTEEIYNRRGRKSKFTQTQLWFLLYSLTQARTQAQAVSQRLGDIRPKNIFLNETGQIKVSNSLTWPLEISNIQKSYDKTPTYLAPEDLLRIEKGESFDSPTDASQAFSIGLSILSAGNLAQYEDLYDLKANNIVGNKFNQALGLWAHNNSFSEVLRGTVLLLLNFNPEQRLSCLELSQLLEKHGENIRNKENFVVDNAPPKLHQEIQKLRSILAQTSIIPPPLLVPASGIVNSEYKFASKQIEEASAK